MRGSRFSPVRNPVHRTGDRRHRGGGGGGAGSLLALGMLGGQMSFREFSKERPFRDLALQARNMAHISAFGNYGYGLIRVSSMVRTSNVVAVTLVNAPGDNPGDLVAISGMRLALTCFADSSFNADGAVITVTNQTHFSYPNNGADGAANISTTADVAGAILGSVALGANGWPIEDHRMIFSAFPGGSESGNVEVDGTYTCTFNGPGYPSDLAAENCTITNYTPGGSTFTLAISNANSGGVVSIRFLGVPADGSYGGVSIVPQGSSASVLRQAYKAAMARYTGGQRWMDAMLTNGDPSIISWASRPRTPIGLGIPIEQIIAAHNEMGPSGGPCWINIPTCASNDYVSGLANYVRDNLNPAIPIEVEYSNEPWNFGASFQQYAWLRGFGKAEMDAIYHGNYGWNEIASLSRTGGVATCQLAHALPASWTTGKHIDTSMADANFTVTNATITKTASDTFTFPVGAGSGAASSLSGAMYGNRASVILAGDSERNVGYLSERWIGKRLYEIGQLFLTSFGSPGFAARVRMKYMSQLAQLAPLAQSVDWLAATYGPVANWLYAIGGAPYSRGSGANVSAILADLNTNVDSSGNSLAAQLHTARYIASKHGIQLHCYEGGTDFTPLNASLTDQTYDNAGLTAAAQKSVDIAFAGGADRLMYFGAGLRWRGLAGASSWGQGENIGTLGTLGSATSNKQKGIDAALVAAPAAVTDSSRIPGTVRFVNGTTDDYDGRSGGVMVNGIQCFQSANDYFEKLYYAPVAGTFPLTFYGKHFNQFNTPNNNMRVFVGKTVATLTLAGTIAMYDDGTDATSGTQGGYASPGTLSVTMQQGWNIIRCQGPAGAQPDRIGVSRTIGT